MIDDLLMFMFNAGPKQKAYEEAMDKIYERNDKLIAERKTLLCMEIAKQYGISAKQAEFVRELRDNRLEWSRSREARIVERLRSNEPPYSVRVMRKAELLCGKHGITISEAHDFIETGILPEKKVEVKSETATITA